VRTKGVSRADATRAAAVLYTVTMRLPILLVFEIEDAY